MMKGRVPLYLAAAVTFTAAAASAAFPPPFLCEQYCRAKGYGCNDFRVGANKLLSCAQACHMRLKLRVPQYECRSYCRSSNRMIKPGRAPDACSLTIAGHVYPLCSSSKCTRHVFQRENAWGETSCEDGVCGSEPCFDGCNVMGDAMVALLDNIYASKDNTSNDLAANCCEPERYA